MNQPHIQQPPEDWRVYFDGNFWGKGRRGARPGKALTVNARFVWGSEQWYVPAVYPCGKGLVVDCCVAVDPARERAFLEKWQPATLDETRLTRAQRDQLDQENPLNVAFRPCVTVNGKQLPPKSSCAISWLPATLLPAGVQNAREAQTLLTHYGLDADKPWSFCPDLRYTEMILEDALWFEKSAKIPSSCHKKPRLPRRTILPRRRICSTRWPRTAAAAWAWQQT